MLNIYKRIINLILFVCAAFIWQSCNVINPVEPTPTYVHIDSFIFKANPSLAGDNLPLTHQITNVVVYYNENPIGSFDLPCTIPVITSGSSGALLIYPGINMDGLNNMTTPYPFYMSDTFTLQTQPGKIITHEPVTEFYSDIKVQPISDFLGLTNFVWAGGNIPMGITHDSLGGEGSSAGVIIFAGAEDSSIDSSVKTFTIPVGTADAFIEFDYQSSLPFYVGMSANLSTFITSGAYYLTGIYPSATWQKFYLNAIDFSNTYPATSYNFYIKTSMPAGQTYGKLLIENINLITF
jgi:hypothetical protein